MTQTTRIQLDPKPFAMAEAISDRLESALADDGVAVSLYEIDEASGLWAVELLADAPDAGDMEARIRAAIDDPTIALSATLLPDTDWVAESLKGLAPVTAGRFFVHGSHDRHLVPAHAVAIEIDAAQAFGTGHHGTTAGCLVVLDRLIKRRRFQRPLDLGCGSGILAIGLAKVLRRRVLASDIDPLAATIAHDNARNNGVGALVHAVTADGFAHRAIRKGAPYDLIIANILARPLMAMATAFYRHLAPGGYAVLSGLRPEDRRRVLAAFRARDLVLCATHYQDGWVTLTLRRPR